MDRLLELTARAEQSHFWFRGFRWFVQPEIARAVAGRSSPTLLDCGCGTGSNVAWLAQYGDAYGFDLTVNGLVLGDRMGRRRIARASLAAIPFPDASVDVATSFDVFQCLPDAVEERAIREVWRVLKPGGHLILNVAALDILRGNHSVLSEEVRRYTPTRLRQVVEGGGFWLDRLTFLNASLFPVMLPVRVAQRWRSGDTLPAGEFDITIPRAPINALLTGLVGLEAAALRLVDMPVGSSLMCHARKPA
ncbi:MAG: class I SAM-dependent methyltransferase [Vicinamibacterales bacterium]